MFLLPFRNIFQLSFFRIQLSVFCRFHRVFCRLHTEFFLETDRKIFRIVEPHFVCQIRDADILILIHDFAGCFQTNAPYKTGCIESCESFHLFVKCGTTCCHLIDKLSYVKLRIIQMSVYTVNGILEEFLII